MPGRRLFVAVPLPEDLVADVADLVGRVRGDEKREVRWVRLDGLHITLRFLGPTLEPRVADAAAAVQRAARSAGTGDVAIEGAGAFPSVERPRAVWLGIGDDAGALGALVSAVEHELVAAGWPPTDRPFRPHLTIARTDGLAAGPAVARRLIEEAGSFRRSFPLVRVALFESITGGGPARYVVLDEAGIA